MERLNISENYFLGGEIKHFGKSFPGVERLKISKKYFPGVERINISKNHSQVWRDEKFEKLVSECGELKYFG